MLLDDDLTYAKLHLIYMWRFQLHNILIGSFICPINSRIDTCSVYEKLSKVLLLLWTMLLWLILWIMMADRDDDYSKWNKMRISARKIALIITKGFDNNVNVPFSLPVTIRRSRYNHDNVWGPYIRFLFFWRLSNEILCLPVA